MSAPDTATALLEFTPLQSALALVPHFDGNNMPLRNFIYDVEEGLAMCPEGTEAKFVKLTITKLRGAARDSVEGRAFVTISALAKHLKDSFTSTGLSFSHYHIQLSHLKMNPGETVTEYGLRAQYLINKTKAALANEVTADKIDGYMDLAKKVALQGFLRGLRSDLEWRVTIKNPTSLDSAIEVARAEEQIMTERHPGRVPPFFPNSPSFPRPFNGTPNRPPPTMPRHPSFSNGERYSHGNQVQVQEQTPSIRLTESNRQFMTPRNNSAFPRPSYQPSAPRYPRREAAAYALYPTSEMHSHYYDPQPFFSPHNYYYGDYPQDHYPSHDYPGFCPTPSYENTWYAEPNVQPNPYTPFGSDENTLRHSVDPCDLSQTRISPTKLQAQSLVQSEKSTGDLNSTSARPTKQEASATKTSQPSPPTFPTYTIMKASQLQKEILSSTSTPKC